MRRIMITLLALIMVGSMLAACTKKSSSDNTQHVLRIASSYGIDEEYFRQQYTELFEFANENIKIEIIPTQDQGMKYGYGGGYSSSETVDPNAEKPKTPLETMIELMDGPNPPDVVVFGFEQMKDLLDKNLLAPLEPQIKSSKFDTTDIVPVVLDSLKSVSEDGQLYALTPTFSSSALIYNKQMFIDAGVTDMPTDNMTWDQVFDLAKRLSVGEGKDHKYGFSFNSQSFGGDFFYSMQAYTQPLQLRMYDDLGEKMTVDTPEWESAITTINQLQKDKVMPSNNMNDIERMKMASGESSDGQPQGPFAYDDFMSGRVAMTIMNYGQLSQIINANKSADTIKGYTKIDWDVVTMPSHPSAPGVVANIGFNNLMAINAKSSNLDNAWKFLEFSNGEKWAQLKSHSTYQMVARKKYITPKEGADFHIEAFYNIKQAPIINNDNKIMQDKPNIWAVQQIGQQVFQEVATDKKTVKAALTEWQTKGNLVLQKIKENPNAQIDPSLYMNPQQPSVQAVPAG
jgi:multiple sugar transport system substrate-binding protein